MTVPLRATRDGGCWGIGQVHRILTRPTYIGRHEFNKRSKSKELKPIEEIVRRRRERSCARLVAWNGGLRRRLQSALWGEPVELQLWVRIF